MMRNIVLLYVLFSFMIILNCSSQKNRRTDGQSLLDERKREIEAVLKLNKPVLLVKQNDIKPSSEIQDIFISNSKLDKFFVEPSSQKKMLNEIFSISKARPSDLPNGSAIMNMENLYRVEMYNYALNATIIGFVDLAHKQVINIIFYKETQPDIPPHLVELAMEMAMNDTAVVNEYGEHKLDQKPIMAGTKTALNRTKCQRSKHLCVAPTFVKGDKALWAIVDLTDLNIAGVKWTQVGETGMAVTQRTMQNDKIMSCYCDKNNIVEKNDWTFSYSMSRSDGLVLTHVQYKKKELFRNVKLVDWHVSYSKIDGFGYSDAVGCPEFSTAAVLAVEPPYFEAIVESGDTTGFLLGQRYYSEGWPTPCNYNYHQYFEFYKDGRFRPVVGSIGRGCGNNGMYRPVTRIALSGENNNFYEWNSNHWEKWKREQWILQSEKTQFQGDHQWVKIENESNQGLMVLANTGQMRDGGRGDNAYVYVTKWDSHRDEGETDLPTIGPCCNKDYHQGLEKFIEPDPEVIEGSSIVIWYVAQMTNDDTKGKEYCWAESVLKNGVYVPVIYPCYSGPMFKPFFN
jgi:hypothetical protein